VTENLWRFRVQPAQPLPDDVRECCEVLRQEALGDYKLAEYPDIWETNAAIWQVLDYLKVL